jgi:hypothetical protein
MDAPQTLQDVFTTPRQPGEPSDHDQNGHNSPRRDGKDEKGNRLALLQAEDQPGQREY